MVEALIVLMLFFPTMCGAHWLCSRFSAKNDPVYRCKVYLDKEGGSCAHVDGPLCHFGTCSTRLAYQVGQHPPALYDQHHRNVLDNGMVVVQEDPVMAVQFVGEKYGWLFELEMVSYEHWEWQPRRLLEPWEIMQAEDQRDRGIILQGKWK